MKEAIIIASKNGWVCKAWKTLKIKSETTAHALINSLGEGNIVIDPLFWQCLINGIAVEKRNTVFPEKWKLEWHRFIDHIAEGRDIDSFFNELIN